MKNFIKSFLIIILTWGQCGLLHAQTASLLPNAVQQFFDNNGNPLTNGTVTTYIAATSTLKTTWKNSAETIVNTNPIILDAGGKAIIYGEGTYRQVVKDRNGNLIWDAVTVPGGGSTPTTVGDGNLVGTILPWANLIAPPNYVFAYGQEIARVTYPEFLASVTSVQSSFCTSGSPILTGLTDTTQLPIGGAVEASCIPAGSTIISKTSSTITVSANANVTTNLLATIYPWGNVNGVNTFNVPDYRGRVLACRDYMGGTAASSLKTTYFGNASGIGVAGGSQSQTLTQAQLSVALGTGTSTSVVTDPGHGHQILGGTGATLSGLKDAGVFSVAGNSNNVAIGYTTAATGGSLGNYINTNTTGITVATTTTITNASGGNPHTIVQPTITLNYIVKITPDASTSVASGVASLGGMTGVIACGSGLTCSANTISTIGINAITQLTGEVLATGPGIVAATLGSSIAGATAFAANGAASVSPLKLNGTWFTGGSATTTKPQLLIEPSGTATTAWNTSGTGLGVNAPSGFVGRLFDLQIAGASQLYFDAAGNLIFPQNGLRIGHQAGSTGLVFTSSNTLTVENGLSFIFNNDAVASTPAVKANGSWFTGGSATTTKPQLLIEPSGTATTAWNTSGTGLGVNAPSGFVGNLLDMQVAAVSKFLVNKDGYLGQDVVFSTGSGRITRQAGVGGLVFDSSNNITQPLGSFIQAGSGIIVPGATIAAFISSATFTSGAGASLGTLTNAPSAGNPTSWIKITDNGVTRYIPAW